MRRISHMRFGESARVLAEGIKTLLNDSTSGGPGGVISSFTAGPISHAKWEQRTKCSEMLPPREMLDEIAGRSREKGLSDPNAPPVTLDSGQQIRLISSFVVP
ncbi:hypothetical protein [Shimia isoporae]|uniref:hypothetical protein n=1 Tax=Shimia isoporae TaxID=647720 RepID=UPI001404A17C|nr:hypothetical protein [Shimia isoporae]